MSKLTEDQMLAARALKSKQDEKNPFLIHRENGRLLPNIAILRKNPKLMPYNGSVKASLDERMRFVRTGTTRQVVDTSGSDALQPPFDVGTASKDDLIAFAFNEFGLTLNPNTPVHAMRRQVVAAANAANGGNGAVDTPADLA